MYSNFIVAAGFVFLHEVARVNQYVFGDIFVRIVLGKVQDMNIRTEISSPSRSSSTTIVSPAAPKLFS